MGHRTCAIEGCAENAMMNAFCLAHYGYYFSSSECIHAEWACVTQDPRWGAIARTMAADYVRRLAAEKLNGAK